jgi:hypothetical protein
MHAGKPKAAAEIVEMNNPALSVIPKSSSLNVEPNKKGTGRQRTQRMPGYAKVSHYIDTIFPLSC